VRPARRALLLVPLCAALVAGTAVVVLHTGDTAPDTLQTSSEGPSLPALPTATPTAVPTLRPTPLPTRVLPTRVPPTPLACPAPEDLPEPEQTWTLAQQAHITDAVSLDGGRLWFLEDAMDGERSSLDVVDLDSGDVRTLPVANRPYTLQRVGQVAWLQTDSDLVRVDLTSLRVTGTWTPLQLAPPGSGEAPWVISVEATADAVYVLGRGGDDHAWLTALDSRSGGRKWSWRGPVSRPRQWSNGRGFGLTADAGGAYVAVVDGVGPRIRVLHLDPAGRVVASIEPPVRTMPYDSPRLAVGPDGVYLSQVLPQGVTADRHGTLLRLDSADLSTEARLDGWERREVHIGSSGVWSRTYGCHDWVLSHHDPRTLAVDREYREPEAMTITFELSGPQPLVVRQTTDAARTGPLEIDLLPSL
jgi:hypothetical protein